MQGILILIAVVIGYFLRDLSLNRLKQSTQLASKRLRGNKSSLVSWEPPKTEEEQAEIEVKKNL